MDGRLFYYRVRNVRGNELTGLICAVDETHAKFILTDSFVGLDQILDLELFEMELGALVVW